MSETLDDPAPTHADAPARPERPYESYSRHLAAAICAQVELGRTITAICNDPGMPSRRSVARWVRDHAAFAEDLHDARRKSETGGPGPKSTYCPDMARIVCARHAHGETLAVIARDPLMPALSTILSWRRRNAEFAEALSHAREAHAEELCQQAHDLMETADPEHARLLSVRLGHLRWLAAIRAPLTHGRLKPIDPPQKPEKMDVILSTWTSETHPVTGLVRSVTYEPNPETGLMHRVYEGEWADPTIHDERCAEMDAEDRPRRIENWDFHADRPKDQNEPAHRGEDLP